MDVQRFVLFGVLGAMIFPVALFTPGGTAVAIADILLVVALSAWLIGAAVRSVPGPWIRGNPLIAPCLTFLGVNLASVAWSQRPHDTVVFAVQLVEIVVALPIVF